MAKLWLRMTVHYDPETGGFEAAPDFGDCEIKDAWGTDHNDDEYALVVMSNAEAERLARLAPEKIIPAADIPVFIRKLAKSAPRIPDPAKEPSRAMPHCEYAYRAPSCDRLALCMRPGRHRIETPMALCNPKCGQRKPRDER